MTGSMGTFPIFLPDDPWLQLATLASEHKTVVGHGQFNIQLKKNQSIKGQSRGYACGPLPIAFKHE